LILQKIEDYLTKHATDYSFAWNTKDPTFLDIYLYPWLARVQMLKDSAANDVYKLVVFDEYPRIEKFLADMRAREEFKPVIATAVAFRHHVDVW